MNETARGPGLASVLILSSHLVIVCAFKYDDVGFGHHRVLSVEANCGYPFLLLPACLSSEKYQLLD